MGVAFSMPGAPASCAMTSSRNCQAGPGHDGHRQRHLRDDEHAAAAPRAAHVGLAAGAQLPGEVGPRRIQCRRQPRESGGDERDGHRERHDGHVDAHRIDAGQPTGDERHHRAQRPRADGEPDQAGRERQQEALGQELRRHPAARGAQRRAHGQLRPPSFAA